MTPEEKTLQQIAAMQVASGQVVHTRKNDGESTNLQRATRHRQSILQKAFNGGLFL
jgi:hypothetical protein